ncbi:hypothetical protein KKF81_05515 [Candidatus Micrarchaeota archaeon]|nr:hypothetical protein [Candidatus Micrarchaeota archaeon]MBU1166386.1 hypothetical protein [Candidatus Micrarchaeota archaeon]MBU1887182.1 hypothetical protein [Candidatus Micrarchaeota archaeon]
MTSADEIIKLKKTHLILEQKMGKIGTSRRSVILLLFNQLNQILNDLESTKEKEKSMWNPAISTRVRLAKREISLGKKLSRFEANTVNEFTNHNLSEDIGKRFMSIAKLVRDNQMQVAKTELVYFEEISVLDQEYKEMGEEIKRKDTVLKREQLRIEKILEEFAWLEKESVNPEKVRRYDTLLKNIEKLKLLRKAYVQSMLSKPLVELLAGTEGRFLGNHYKIFQENDELTQLKQFFSDYPVFGKCNAIQIREFFGYSEKKLSHVCPETSRFKKLILGNQDMFETVGSLEHTSFMAVDEMNNESLDFYAGNVGGAKEIVIQIRQLKKEKNSDREEYEKSKIVEKRREALAGYSKTNLEAELASVLHLLELLHSDNSEGNIDETPGLFSGISAFIKKFAGKS